MTFRLFTADDRDAAAVLLLDALVADQRIERVVPIGSWAEDRADERSDLDLAVVVAARAVPREVATDTAKRMETLFPVVRHFQVPFDELRVAGFLLENALEIDLVFGHEHALARYAQDRPREPDPVGRAKRIVDFVWHDVTHAATALERGHLWRALFYVERIRNDTIELAALRTGSDAHQFRDVDALPQESLGAVAHALVGHLGHAELAAALRAATAALFAEARRLDPELPGALEQTLAAYLDTVLAASEAPARAR